MILRELTNDEFNAFTNNNYTSIYQSSNYALTMTKQGFECYYFGILEDNKIYGASLILLKKEHGFKYAYVPRGYLIDYNNFELLKEYNDLLKKQLKKMGVVGIRINPPIIKGVLQNNNFINNNNYENMFNNLKKLGYNHLGYNNYFEGLKPRYEAIIQLNKNIPSIFYRIHKSFRTKIRSADHNGIKIFKADENNLDILFMQTKNKYPRDLKYFQDMYYYFKNNDKIDLYYSLLNTSDYVKNVQLKYQQQTIKCNQANANVFKNVGKNNTKSINKKLYEENRLNIIKKELVYATKLLKDFPQGIITSSVLILKNKSEVYMIMDGYDKTYKQLNSKHLLIWKLIEKYANEGYKIFNLGGIGNYNLKDNKYVGLTEFKRNFGAVIYEYCGDFGLVINKPMHLLFKNSSAVMNLLRK